VGGEPMKLVPISGKNIIEYSGRARTVSTNLLFFPVVV
jgi:hypothetical protein